MFGAACDKKREDKMRRGYDDGYKGPLGFFNQSFLTFRGVKMGEPKWFDAYVNKVGQMVNMPGTTSTSSNLGVALDFSKCSILDIAMTGKSVLFVFFFKNFIGFPGFRLNQPEFSAFPEEEEYLLCEGIPVFVLAVDENIVMDCNTIDAVKDMYHGQTINIVYLYNDDRRA